MTTPTANHGIALLFPPLVSTNVGRYYPSTAVLAGALSARGYRSRQVDLNASFVSHCLRQNELERAGGGRLVDGTDVEMDLLPSIAARILDKAGAHSGPRPLQHVGLPPLSRMHLIGALLEPLRIDEPVTRLASDGFDHSALAGVYHEVFASDTQLAAAMAGTHTVGISVPMGPQLGPSVLLARFIRARWPDAAIVFGGSTFSLMSTTLIETLLHSFPIDAIVRFDGEVPFSALVEQRSRGSWQPWTVAGTSALDPKGRVFHVPPRKGLGLDELAFAEYDPSVVAAMDEPELAVVQARGCYWGRCTYCDYVELYEGSPRFRTRTAARFVDELEYQIERHGVHRYAVISEALPPAFARRVAREILDRGVSIRWYSFAMVDSGFTPETFDLLSRSGCELLIIGLETMTDRVLRLVQKASSAEANRLFMTRARTAGVRLSINLIPDLPTTTFQEAQESLEDLKGMRDCVSQVSVFPFEATASSQIGRRPDAFGLRVADGPAEPAQAEFCSNHLSVRDDAMTDEQRTEVHQAYRAYAQTVNAARLLEDAGILLRRPENPESHLRIVDEVLDVQVDGGDMVYFHCITRDHFRMPRAWHEAVDYLRERQPFSILDTERWLLPEQAGVLVDRLLAFRLLGRWEAKHAEDAARPSLRLS